MNYAIDGYNLLFRLDPESLRSPRQRGGQTLEEKRRSLLVQIGEVADLLHLDLILVFDGADAHLPYATRPHFGPLRIVYTPERQSADAYLLELVVTNRKKPLTIVTSDTALARDCRSQGALTLSVEAFLDLIRKQLSCEERRGQEEKPPSLQTQAIERYLKIFEARLRNISELGNL